MITSFLKAIDTSTKLLTLRRAEKERIFDHIVRPLYAEMPTIVRDYLLLFRESLELLDSEGPSEAAKKIAARRDEFLTTRIKVREMARVVKHHVEDEEVVEFSERVLSFFFSSQVAPFRKGASPSKALLAEMHDLGANPDLDRDEIKLNIHKVLRNIESRWALITSSYAKLNIKYKR